MPTSLLLQGAVAVVLTRLVVVVQGVIAQVLEPLEAVLLPRAH
jgi:hypothetical protein